MDDGGFLRILSLNTILNLGVYVLLSQITSKEKLPVYNPLPYGNKLSMW